MRVFRPSFVLEGMYWIYLIIFVLAILTPELIQYELTWLREDDIESLLIFCFGVFGFMIYLAKEKTLLRVFREKLHLQKQANIITRDLSDSYSYIGEMNRKLDIVKELIFALPKATAESFGKEKGVLYRPLLEAASLLTKTDQVTLGFADKKAETWSAVYMKDTASPLGESFSSKRLFSEGKYFWEENDTIIVRSPRPAQGVSAFLIFSKTRNHFEDGEVLKLLVSEALLLYCMERGVREQSNKK